MARNEEIEDQTEESLFPDRRIVIETDKQVNSVRMAQTAEERGFERVWYAEHHNMAQIGSSATSVLIAHVGAHTRAIRLGAGGIMLPNHSPLVIAATIRRRNSSTPAPDRTDSATGGDNTGNVSGPHAAGRTGHHRL